MEMQVVFGEGLVELQRHHRQQQQLGTKERLFSDALSGRTGLSKEDGRRRRARPEEGARSSPGSSEEEEEEWGGERKRRREQSGLLAVAAAAEEAVTSLCVRRRKAGGEARQEEEGKVAGAGPSGRPAAPSAVPAAHNGWHVDDIDDNLAADLEGSLSGLEVDLTSSSSSYHMSESLLSLPTLTVFKQEVLSPTSQNDTGCANHSAPVAVATNGGVCRTEESPREGNSPSSDLHLQAPEQQAGLHMLHYTMSSERNNLAGQLCKDAQMGSSLEIDGGKRREDTASGGSVYNGVSMGNRAGINEPSSFERFQMRFEKSTVVEASDHVEDSRFQYVLAAATSIATKVNEETLTYLNQGQSYEIKLKKLGDLLAYRGKIFKSIIRICFHERRLQYAEREQLAAWQQSRPGDRVLEVDVPLSYGACDIVQDPCTLNSVEFLWDPTKEVGVYIKVNCISTEFTPKKHGGEKGVPFRIQVETYSQAPNSTEEPPKKASAFVTGRRLHAAACQIKVFKLKGADRKHKQDREKILKRPPSEQEKYQPSYECTVLNDIHPDSVYLGPLTIGHSSSVANVPNCSPSDNSQNVVTSQSLIKEEGSGSPGRRCIPLVPPAAPPPPALPERIGSQNQPSLAVPTISVSSSTPMATSGVEALAEPVGDCFSPRHGGQVWRDSPEILCSRTGKLEQPSDSSWGVILKTLTGDATAAATAQWLRSHRFSPYLQTFSLFSGADLLRLSRDDLIQICGLADGIRLYNALHLKAIVPRLTLYVCLSRREEAYSVDGVDECMRRSSESPVYHALYLTRASCDELSTKVALLAGIPTAQLMDVFVQGPSGIHVLLTDDVVQNLADDSLFTVDILKDCSGERFRLLLKSASC